jgi:hypothetical protein
VVGGRRGVAPLGCRVGLKAGGAGALKVGVCYGRVVKVIGRE